MRPEDYQQQRDKQAELLRLRIELIEEQVKQHLKHHKVGDATARFLEDLGQQYSILTNRYISSLEETGHAVPPTNEELMHYNNDLWQMLHQYQREQLLIACTVTRLKSEVDRLKKKTRTPRKKPEGKPYVNPEDGPRIITL